MEGLNIPVEELKELMKKEIRLMRELLFNMHQEEIAFILSDKKSWMITLQERFPIIQSLGFLRQKRQDVMGTGRNYPRGQKLPTFSDEDSIDITLLAEQVLTLVDKMNEQNIKNQRLTHNFETPARIADTLTIPLPSPSIRGKTTLATYPPEQR